MAQAATLSTAEPNEVIADEGLLYFRRPDGEIFAADAGGFELGKRQRRGMQPLFDYGQFGSSAYYMDNPFEPLFQAGGAHEMSAQQVISLGYHLRPPLIPTCGQHVGQSKDHLAHKGRPGGRTAREAGCWRGARTAYFPQLEGMQVPGPQSCDYCGRDDLPTPQALAQHQSVMHRDRSQQNELADGIVAGLQRAGALGSRSDVATIAAAVIAAMRGLEQPQAKATRPARVRVRKPVSKAAAKDDDDD